MVGVAPWCVIVLVACGTPPAEAPVGRCDPAIAFERCPGDTWECGWGTAWAARGNADELGELVTMEADPDALLRAVFPASTGKVIVDVEEPIPPGGTFQMPSFDVYALPASIDWNADPFANNTWQLYFQTLQLAYFQAPGDLDALAVALLVAWRDQVLYEAAPPSYTWADAAVGIRLTNVAGLLDRYIASHDVLARSVLQAGAEVIITHLYALAAESCYVPVHNHGMMQDLALLEYARRYPVLRDGLALWEHGQRRAIAQADAGVSSDGLHIENTSAYHSLFLSLLNHVIRAHQAAGQQVPERLVAIRDSMFEPLAQQLQPDGTWPQFGDARELLAQSYIAGVLEESDALGVGQPAARSALEWVATSGAAGVEPAVDVIYEHSGYAAFRDHWGADGASLHFKTGHLGAGHYRPDETAFELHAHGVTIITQPGLYSYADEPFADYPMHPAAQNVLVVDGDPTRHAEATRRSRIVNHGEAAGASWVQGTHDNFKTLGIDRLVRTVVFAKPDVVIVVDHVRAAAAHDYAQHFHLAPSLDELVTVDDRTVAIAAPLGPTLTIAAGFSPRSVHGDRGVADGADIRGWYFPTFREAAPAYDVVFESRGATVDLPVVLAVAAPGQPATAIANVAMTSDDVSVTVSWSQDGAPRSVTVASP